MNTNSASTGSFTENPFWYQKFDLRQIRILRGGQPTVEYDTSDKSCLYVTTMNFGDDIPSVIVTTLNSLFSRWDELNNFSTWERYRSFCFGRTDVFSKSRQVWYRWKKTFNMDNVSLRQKIDRLPLFKYSYIGSYPCYQAPNLPSDQWSVCDHQHATQQDASGALEYDGKISTSVFLPIHLVAKITVSWGSTTNGWLQSGCRYFPASVDSTRFVLLFSSSSDRKKCPGLMTLLYSHL